MATVNFSVPEDVKRAFNETFAKENKSAVIARLMIQAVEQRRLRSRRSAAIESLRKISERLRPLTDEEVDQARKLGLL